MDPEMLNLVCTRALVLLEATSADIEPCACLFSRCPCDRDLGDGEEIEYLNIAMYIHKYVYS